MGPRESSASRGWLSSSPLDDERRRLALCFAAAVAFVEIVAALIPLHRPTAPPRHDIVMVTTITRRVPPPVVHTPRPIVHTHKVAPTQVAARVVSPARPSRNEHRNRVASAPAVPHIRFKPAHIHVVTGGHGFGSSRAAKPLTGGTNGTGTSGNGNGTGGLPAAQQPCGYVDFVPDGSPDIDQATGRIWQQVQIVVHFPDGSAQTLQLDYPWYYPARAVDPFFPENANLPATFQFPPPDQRAQEPPLVQYVMAHTTPHGYTLLRNCPNG